MQKAANVNSTVPHCPKQLVIALLVATVSGCAGQTISQPSRPVNVLLVTLDTTRADRLGCYGNGRIDTPHLDRLAREGTLFEQAFTPIPSTLPSHCSIMTGNYPAYHGVHDNGVYSLDDTANTLAEILQSRGYDTAAFVSAFVLDHQFQLDQGFNVYDDQMRLPLIQADPVQLAEKAPEDRKRRVAQLATKYHRRAEDVTPQAIEWLRQERAKPFFLWVHFFDPHQPYQAPGEWATKYDADYTGPMDGDSAIFFSEMERHGKRYRRQDWQHMVARYDAEIAYMDHWIGRLLQACEEIDRADETLVIVVGDHGESFGEHNIQIWEHNQTAFDEVMRVPLIIRRPDGVGAGTKVSRLVRTIDVAPTVLDSLGHPGWEKMQGESLLSLLEDPRAYAPGEILVEARRGKQVLTAKHSYVGLRNEQFKLILTLHPEQDLTVIDAPKGILAVELYDVKRDPQEKTSLIDEQAKRVDSMKQDLADKHGEVYRDINVERELNALESEALRSLGYVK